MARRTTVLLWALQAATKMTHLLLRIRQPVNTLTVKGDTHVLNVTGGSQGQDLSSNRLYVLIHMRIGQVGCRRT